MRTAAYLVTGMFVAAGCNDDVALVEVQPRLQFCATARLLECDIVFHLGERTTEIPSSHRLFAANRGSGVLEIDRFDTTAPVTFSPLQASVAPQSSLPVELTITPTQLGPTEATFDVHSNDPMRPKVTVRLFWIGVPPPAPVIELCTTSSSCAANVSMAITGVRRTQQDSQEIVVANRGEGPLDVSEILLDDRSSVAGELSLGTSSRPGRLRAGSEATFIVVYTPMDDVDDQATLTFVSNDPANPRATAEIVASSFANLPPEAVVQRVGSATATAPKLLVPITFDGSMSSDPEGDPLVYDWTLEAPTTSSVALVGPTSPRAVLVPDVVGTYTVRLTVRDSLMQPSLQSAEAVVHVRPDYRLSVDLSWASGADLDLHVAPEGQPPFSMQDCYYAQPNIPLGIPGDPRDDLQFVDDATVAPGLETIRVVDPAAGRYTVYVHYFDSEQQRPAPANVKVHFDGAANAAHDSTLTLSSTCELWQVGVVTFPGPTFVATATATTQLCP